MASRFTEYNVMRLALRHLAPGETICFRARGVVRSSWSPLLFGAAVLFYPSCLLVATERRLLMIRHVGLLGGYEEESFESRHWSEIESCSLHSGVMCSTLSLVGTRKRWRLVIDLYRFQMEGNIKHAEGLVSTCTWQRARQPQSASNKRAPTRPNGIRS